MRLPSGLGDGKGADPGARMDGPSRGEAGCSWGSPRGSRAGLRQRTRGAQEPSPALGRRYGDWPHGWWPLPDHHPGPDSRPRDVATDNWMEEHTTRRGETAVSERDYSRPPEDHDDSDEWGEPVRGRPAKAIEAVFSLRLSRETAEKLRAAAARAGMPTSRFAREVIEAFLDEPASAPPAPLSDVTITAIGGAVSFYGSTTPLSSSHASAEAIRETDSQLSLA